MTADQLVAQMLFQLRRDFYLGRNKVYYQDGDLLRMAICCPAKYLNERGAKAPASKYLEILATVIGAIKAKGNRGAIHSFGRYFLHCVQEHMRFNGEKYYYQAKEPRAIASLVDPAVRKLRANELADTSALAIAYHALYIKSGRKRAPPAPQPDLFGPGNMTAA